MPEPGDRALTGGGHPPCRPARRLGRRASLIAFGGTLLLTTIVAPPRPRLLWNASASLPVGLYEVRPYARIARGDAVAARMPVAVRGLAARRSYLPVAVPLVKRVGAVGGDIVCARGATILINGRVVASRRARDGQGREMPLWRGCRRLGRDELFLLVPGSPRSFDGRYFGVTQSADLIGRAVPLWVR